MDRDVKSDLLKSFSGNSFGLCKALASVVRYRISCPLSRSSIKTTFVALGICRGLALRADIFNLASLNVVNFRRLQ